MSEQDKLNSMFTDALILIKSIQDDYINTMAELTGVSKEDIGSRLSHIYEVNKVKILLELKDHLDFGNDDI